MLRASGPRHEAGVTKLYLEIDALAGFMAIAWAVDQ